MDPNQDPNQSGTGPTVPTVDVPSAPANQPAPQVEEKCSTCGSQASNCTCPPTSTGGGGDMNAGPSPI